MTMEPLLSVENLRTHFFTPEGIVRAVDGVSLRIFDRQPVALVGESGCGKSMTALSIMGLVPRPPGQIVAGKILLRKRNLLELTDDQMSGIRGKEISMVFQDPMTFLNPVIRIGDQIAEAVVRHQKVDKREARERVIELLDKVRIPDAKRAHDYYPHQLSGGMRQRVLIAMALSCRPSLLIADEPTTALDVTIQSQILGLISSAVRDLGTSLLLITHDLGIVASLVEVVYVMYVGKIVEHGDLYSVYEEPAHPYTQGLLKSVLSIDEFKKDLVTIGGIVPDALNPPRGCPFHPRCPKAMDICREREPNEVEVKLGHFVSCWLYC